MPITPRPKTPRETSRDVPSTRLPDLRRAAAPVTVPSGPSEAEQQLDQALDTLLGRGRERVEDGATPRLPVQSYLAALQPVLEFVRSQPALMDEPSLSPAMCRAALRVAQELTGGATGEPLRIPPPLTVRHEEALRTGVLLLSAYRAAVERGLSPDPEREGVEGGESAEDIALRAELAPLTQRARAEFGLDEQLGLGSVRDGALLADRIARFLAAAERYPEHLVAAELTGAQLVGLMAQERVLRALAVQRDEASLLPGQPFRAQVLHAALECFFDRYSAALWVRLIDLPMARAAGLRLLPRPGGPRSSGRPTTSGHPGLDLAACHITESGRLIFG